MAEFTHIFTKKDGTLKLVGHSTTSSQAGGGAIDTNNDPVTNAKVYTVAFEQGTLAVQVTGETVSEALDRGAHTSPPSLRYGDDGVVNWSFSCYLRQFTHGSDDNILQIIDGNGSGWISSLEPDGSSTVEEVFTLDLVAEYSGVGSGNTGSVGLKFSRITYDFDESGEFMVLNLSGVSYVNRPQFHTV
jgi:hypothetical protein